MDRAITKRRALCLVLIAAVLLSLFSALGCSNDSSDDKKTYSITVQMDYAPVGEGYKLYLNGGYVGMVDSEGKAEVTASSKDIITVSDGEGMVIGGTTLGNDKAVTIKCFLPAATFEWKEGYKILVLADVQFGRVQQVNSNFDSYIEKIVKSEDPDIIVLTGDQVENFEDGRAVFDVFLQRMEGLQKPWAVVFGNHDGQNLEVDIPPEAYYTKDVMAQMYASAQNCLFVSGPDRLFGNGNYFIDLVSEGKEKYTLFLLDSGSNNETTHLGYDYIKQNQIQWYSDIVNGHTAKNGAVVPSLAFFHIPLPEFVDARDQFLAGGEGYGTFGENICCPLTNSGFFRRIQELKSTQSVICGHDHNNTCCIKYQGVQMIYGMKSSNAAYNNGTLGFTTITLTSNGDPQVKNTPFSEIQ